MKRPNLVILLGALGLLGALSLFAGEMKGAAKGSSDWTLNATIIEACSCPMFCQCYFNSQPAAPAGHEGHGGSGHFCRFNNAFRVNSGMYQGAKPDGAKFWVAGDLGGDFSHGQMDWAILTFDKSMTKEQRDGIAAILAHLYPVKWSAFTTAEGDISWKAGKGEAHAALDGGKAAEVVLKATSSASNPADPVVIKNLKYWGAPRNDGFILMPNEVEAYRAGDKPFEFKNTNGFMITLDINARNAPPAAGAM